MASPLQVEAFATVEAAGSVSSRDELAVVMPADGSSQVAAPGDSAALRADDSVLPEASASASPLQAESFAAAEAAGSVSSRDHSAVALPEDHSAVALPEDDSAA